MGKESLERLTDEQIESISGGVNYSSEDELRYKCPHCGYVIQKEEFRDTKYSKDGTIQCPKCKERFNALTNKNKPF